MNWNKNCQNPTQPKLNLTYATMLRGFDRKMTLNRPQPTPPHPTREELYFRSGEILG